MHRERAEQDARHRGQMETAMMRYDEVDAENRSLRAAKYELETKVRLYSSSLLLTLSAH